MGLIPGLGRSPGGGMATHTSILSWRIPTERGAWWATVHGIAELDTTEQLSMHTHTHTHTHTHASRGGGKLELRIANTARISKQVAKLDLTRETSKEPKVQAYSVSKLLWILHVKLLIERWVCNKLV